MSIRPLFPILCIGLFLSACGDKTASSTAPDAAVSTTQPASTTVKTAATPLTTPPKAASGPGELSHTLAAGTEIPVLLKTVLDSQITLGGFVSCEIESDVKGADGRVAIPGGSPATIVIRDSGRNGDISSLDLGLYAVHINGEQYSLSNGSKDVAKISFREDAGKGSGHAAVHLEYNHLLVFKVDSPMQLH